MSEVYANATLLFSYVRDRHSHSGGIFRSIFCANGLDLMLFLKSLFVNGAAGGFSADVLISIPVFWVWSFLDAGKAGVKRWWWVLPASFFVGLSLALPLYLYLRTKAEDV